MSTTEKLDTNALFTQYVNVVNRAIGEHKDETPYKQLIEASQKLASDKKFGVAVYEDDADQPHDYFTLRFQDDGKLDLVSHGKESPDIDWKTDEDYLRKVVENQQEYVDNPARLDFDWLKTRVGLA